MVKDKVYWAEIQSELIQSDLDVVLDMFQSGSTWFANLQGKPFSLTVPPKDGNGEREFMIVGLRGQNEKEVIPKFSEFIGYLPFCRYLSSEDKNLVYYEWKKDKEEELFEKLLSLEYVYNLEFVKDKFKMPKERDVRKLFQEFTPEIVDSWEREVSKNPKSKWNNRYIFHLLPFLKKVMPRVSYKQDILGLSICCLESKTSNEESILSYALEPLLFSGIVTEEEAKNIIYWFSKVDITQKRASPPRFKKEFMIEGVKYLLITDFYPNQSSRSLNLSYAMIKDDTS